MEYDALELCSPELKEKLAPARDLFENLRQKKIEKELVSQNIRLIKLSPLQCPSIMSLCRVYHLYGIMMKMDNFSNDTSPSSQGKTLRTSMTKRMRKRR